MVIDEKKYNKIARFINDPFDPAIAKIVGGVGGIFIGLGIAGGIIASESLKIPSAALVFFFFGLSGCFCGIYIISYVSKNSASLSTILCAFAGTDFAGPLGAIMATASIGTANIILKKTANVTIDSIFADGLVATIKGIDQIVYDSKEAVEEARANEAAGKEHEKLKSKKVEVGLSRNQDLVMHKTVNKLANKTAVNKKPKKSFIQKLEEAREVEQDLQLKR